VRATGAEPDAIYDSSGDEAIVVDRENKPLSVVTERRPIEVDAEAALTALRRARRRAERLAVATGTLLVQMVQGKVVRVPPTGVLQSGEDEK
jgi:hypothetical protein